MTLSEIADFIPTRVPEPTSLNSYHRHKLSTLLRRLNYLAASSTKAGKGYALAEIAALKWALCQIVGRDIVNEWIERYGIPVDPVDDEEA